MNQQIEQQLNELNEILTKNLPDFSLFSEEKRKLVGKFYKNLVEESAIQNLTRLLSPEDFYQGHLVDVLELQKTGWIGKSALDLGSGGGVPGLLAALLADPPFPAWVVVDSEKRKAEYLARSVDVLGLSHRVVSVHARAEEYLKGYPVETVVARAVGNVEKIYGWLSGCSTWNNLVLFKGPKWDEEWAMFKRSKFASRLTLEATHEYQVGTLNVHSRKIVKLRNVPRGTK